MPPLPADFIHARACKLKCEKILTRPAFLHRLVFRAVLLIPDRVGLAAAFLLVCAYAVDFAVSAYQAYQNAHTSTEAEPVPGRAAR